MGIIVLAVVIVILILLAFGTFFTVQTQTNTIIERFGRFVRIAQPGLNVKIPLIEKKAGVVSLRVQQLDLQVETKTKDNVFVLVLVSVQYAVLPQRVADAWYRLDDPEAQIKSYVFDAVRATVPNLQLDEAFERKDDIAQTVGAALAGEMGEFGYQIIKTLVTDINPDASVKSAMNRINAAQRERVAAQDLAEADRIRVVTEARAEAEAKQLQGEGIANQRKAIIDGLHASIAELRHEGIEESDVINLILLTQYFDTLTTLGRNGATTVLLPGTPGGVSQLGDEIRTALLTQDAVREGQTEQRVAQSLDEARNRAAAQRGTHRDDQSGAERGAQRGSARRDGNSGGGSSADGTGEPTGR
ncbi:SPFH domain-containing protein [Pseudoclavibacter sp. CFCC 13796]|uniref:SPFH domain-containing protein n=1 Tax=Pseudoclavibacter sp. CFCC 13796 TaxID=2615179 RepID=UPI00130135BD|nr:SPFH domain-containing protein [Pseudoclavibacter sp. CFCC 13796]KAB1660735.1 SPFH domain-containing protein [Pseudoclavibacter sp. CFCC 13796]